MLTGYVDVIVSSNSHTSTLCIWTGYVCTFFIRNLCDDVFLSVVINVQYIFIPECNEYRRCVDRYVDVSVADECWCTCNMQIAHLIVVLMTISMIAT